METTKYKMGFGTDGWTILAICEDGQMSAVSELEIPYIPAEDLSSIYRQMYGLVTMERPELPIAMRTAMANASHFINSIGNSIGIFTVDEAIEKLSLYSTWHYSPFVPEAAELGSWCIDRRDPENPYGMPDIYYRCLCGRILELDIDDLVAKHCKSGSYARPVSCVNCDKCCRHMWPSLVPGPDGLLPPCLGEEYHHDEEDNDDHEYGQEPEPEGEKTT